MHLTFHSLHALLINGYWVAYQKQESEIKILYRTLQICIKFNLVCSLCKESKHYHFQSISHVLNCQFVFYFLSQEFTLLHLGISHAHNVLAIYALFFVLMEEKIKVLFLLLPRAPSTLWTPSISPAPWSRRGSAPCLPKLSHSQVGWEQPGAEQ